MSSACSTGGSVTANLPDLSNISSPPGTELPYALEVAEGSVLLGPVAPATFSEAEGEGWQAVVAVMGDPASVWQSYVEQLSALAPRKDPRLDRPGLPGCTRSADEPWDPISPSTCAVAFVDIQGEGYGVSATMSSVPGDVTGRHLILLTGNNTHMFRGFADADQYVAGNDLPNPELPRTVEAGDPLAPNAGLGGPIRGDSRYVLLDGSELVALIDKGFGTGGFLVMVKVSPEAELGDLLDRYAEQNRAEDPVFRNETTFDGATVTRLAISQGAGGPDARLWGVDRSGTDNDYLFYEVRAD